MEVLGPPSDEDIQNNKYIDKLGGEEGKRDPNVAIGKEHR